MTTMTLAEISKSLREDAAWWREKKPEIIQARKLDIFADAIDAHLAKGAQVPDEPSFERWYWSQIQNPLANAYNNPLGIPTDGNLYDAAKWGWNACRQVMLSQRWEVE